MAGLTGRTPRGRKAGEPAAPAENLDRLVTVILEQAAAVPQGPRALPELSPAALVGKVESTLLRPEAGRGEIDRLCDDAVSHGFLAVCVNGRWVRRCSARLDGTNVMTVSVVGFPLGATTTRAKAAEARMLVEDGADELDVVAPLGAILEGEWGYMEDELRAAADAASGRPVKAILETAALDPARTVRAALVACRAGARFLKTSTGHHARGGATPDAVKLLRLAAGDRVGVKAAGGVRDRAAAVALIAAGADRIGTSRAPAIVS